MKKFQSSNNSRRHNPSTSTLAWTSLRTTRSSRMNRIETSRHCRSYTITTSLKMRSLRQSSLKCANQPRLHSVRSRSRSVFKTACSNRNAMNSGLQRIKSLSRMRRWRSRLIATKSVDGCKKRYQKRSSETKIDRLRGLRRMKEFVIRLARSRTPLRKNEWTKLSGTKSTGTSWLIRHTPKRCIKCKWNLKWQMERGATFQANSSKQPKHLSDIDCLNIQFRSNFNSYHP